MKKQGVGFFKRFLSSEALAPHMGVILPAVVVAIMVFAVWRA